MLGRHRAHPGKLSPLHLLDPCNSLIYLLLYNFAFILPLLVVFALSYWGVSSQSFTGWMQRSMKTVKLLLAALFVGLAVLTLVT